jgi:hypothetical protein
VTNKGQRKDPRTDKQTLEKRSRARHALFKPLRPHRIFGVRVVAWITQPQFATAG